MSTPSMTILQVRIEADPPERLDKALARDVPEEAALSRSRLMKLITEGAVARDGSVVTDVKARTEAGDIWEISLAEAAETDLIAEDIALEIIHEDDALIVINKPAGMVVHPAPGSASGTLVNALLHHCGDSILGIGGERRPGIVHRIDKETTGLLVVAKSDKAHHGLSAQFAKHTVERHYNAVVYGVPDAADPRLRGLRGVSFEPGNILCVRANLDRHRHDRQKMAVSVNGGRHAVTRARVLESFGQPDPGQPAAAALLECWLETGRTHQIRVHLAYAGHALIGDQTYGGRRKLSGKALGAPALAAAAAFGRQALHARTLGFVHPLSGKALSFEAPLPQDMEALIAALRGA